MQFKRVQQAVDHITTAVQTAAVAWFPWADRITVRAERPYAWYHSEPREVKLPETDENTVGLA